MNERRKEYSQCWKCGCEIVWDSRIPEDSYNFTGVVDKAQNHIDNDPSCKREIILSELLNEKKEHSLKLVGVENHLTVLVKEDNKQWIRSIRLAI